MAEDSAKKEKGKSWVKLLSVLAGGGVLAAIISFALPKIWPENKPPAAAISINETKGNAPLRILADGLKSSDPEGKELKFEWMLNQTPISSESSFEKTLEDPGLNTIMLTVTDEKGLQGKSSTIVEVLKPAKKRAPTLILDVFSEQESSSSETLRYDIARDSNKVSIMPVDRYLGAVYGGETIKPLNFTYSPWEWDFSFPSLDIKLVNNTEETIFLHEAVFHVKRSWLDKRPLPIIDGTGYYMKLPLRNIGWGSMHDAVIRFVLIDPANYREGDLEYPYIVNAKTIETRLETNDLTSFFEKAGVNISRLAELQRSIGRSGDWIHFSKDSPLWQSYKDDGFLGEIRRMPKSEYIELLKEAYGPFESGGAVVIGEMQYGSIEKSGNMVTRTNKFVAMVRIGGPRPGAPAPPSHKYSVKLRVDGSDYEVRIPISQVIEPGKADRFLLQVAADKSSFHEFVVTLSYNEGNKMTSNPISLDLFLSRDDAGLIARDASEEIVRLTSPSSGRQH